MTVEFAVCNFLAKAQLRLETLNYAIGSYYHNVFIHVATQHNVSLLTYNMLHSPVYKNSRCSRAELVSLFQVAHLAGLARMNQFDDARIAAMNDLLTWLKDAKKLEDFARQITSYVVAQKRTWHCGGEGTYRHGALEYAWYAEPQDARETVESVEEMAADLLGLPLGVDGLKDTCGN
jgi:hypothetical protein